MTNEAPTRPRRTKSLLFQLSEDLLLPRDASNVPAPVAELNERAWAKFEAYLAANKAAGEAAHVAKAAPRHDELAFEAALAADEKPPKQTTPLKREKAEAAKREAAAAEKVAKQSVFDLWNAVEEHQAEYVAGREAAYEAVAARPRELLDELASTWEAVEREADLLRVARLWHNNVRSAALASNVRSSGNRIAKAERDQASRLRDDMVRNTFEHLLVALRRKVEELAKP